MLASLCLAVLALPAACPQDVGDDQVLRLRDGQLVVGSIAQHDLDGLVVESARNGGRFALTWDKLYPGEEERLKRSFGYPVGQVSPMIVADQLRLKDGRVRIGRILRRDERAIELRIRETTALVPISRLAAPPETVSVPAAQVLTAEQFYDERKPSVDPNDRLAQYQFARELETVFALDQAKVHYEAARELAAAAGDEPLSRRIDNALDVLALNLANRSQAEALETVRQLIHRERFTQAEDGLDAFASQYPDSPLEGAYLDLRDKFERERVESLERALSRGWYNASVALLKRKALDRQSSMDQLIDWTENTLPGLVRQKLLADLQGMYDQVQLADVDAYWLNRFNHSPKRFQASFGDGSWILGADRARKGLEDDDKEKEDTRTQAEREFEERVQRYLESVNRARSQTTADGLEDPEDWWRKATPTERFQFLFAYYAEFSGDYTVTSVRFDRCPTCGGTGVIATIDLGAQGAQQNRKVCPRCHQVQVRRAITFR